jgi:hypothetical protein
MKVELQTFLRGKMNSEAFAEAKKEWAMENQQ